MASWAAAPAATATAPRASGGSASLGRLAQAPVPAPPPATLAPLQGAAKTPERRSPVEGYVWEAQETDDLWVQGVLGDALLRRADPGSALRMRLGRPAAEPKGAPPRPSAPPLAKAEAEAPAVARRQRCKASCPERPCLCERYDPVLMLPVSLFDRLELSGEFRGLAYQLAEAAPLPEGLQGSELQVDVQDAMCPAAGRCNAVCFRVRRLRRHLVAEGARSAAHRDGAAHAAALALARLDQAEFEANCRLLPELRRLGEEFRAVKAHKVAEEKRAALKKLEEETHMEMRKTNIEESMVLMATSPEELVEAEGHLLDFDQTRQSFGSTLFSGNRAIGASFGERGPGRPLVLCRCGHAEVWHAEAFDPAAASAPRRHAAVGTVPFPRGCRRSGSTSALRPATPDKTATLSGGALKKAGASLLALTQQG